MSMGSVGGLAFEIGPEVAPITDGSLLLAAQLQPQSGERVLDLGTGCGVQAVVAAREGAQVVATDVVPACLECARVNAQRFGVAELVEFRLGSGFAPVAGEQFDWIVTSPPQLPGLASVTDALREADDDGRAVLDLVLRQAAAHLRPGGQLLLVQFAFHDVDRSLHTLRASGLEARVIAERATPSTLTPSQAARLRACGLTAGIDSRGSEVWLRRCLIRAQAHGPRINADSAESR